MSTGGDMLLGMPAEKLALALTKTYHDANSGHAEARAMVADIVSMARQGDARAINAKKALARIDMMARGVPVARGAGAPTFGARPANAVHQPGFGAGPRSSRIAMGMRLAPGIFGGVPLSSDQEDQLIALIDAAAMSVPGSQGAGGGSVSSSAPPGGAVDGITQALINAHKKVNTSAQAALTKLSQSPSLLHAIVSSPNWSQTQALNNAAMYGNDGVGPAPTNPSGTINPYAQGPGISMSNSDLWYQ